MRIIKYTHSCVRIEVDGTALVIDPGIWSEAAALPGCAAVLVTHEHFDHVDVPRLAGLGVPVYAPAGADIEGIDVISVQPGDQFTVAGIAVRAVGGRHAAVYDGQPDCPNLGYLVSDRLYHPGDALHVPDQPVETLLVPMQASWLKTAEAIGFVQAVQPERAFGIHEAQLSERGLSSVNGWLAAATSHGYRWLAAGQPA